MKFRLSIVVCTLLAIFGLTTTVHAQLKPSNNLGIFPPGNPGDIAKEFDPNGKFTSIGESGGVPGPINNCDLYGFRAQVDSLTAVNLGIQRLSASFQFPTLTFSRWPFLILQQNATGPGGGNTFGCGKILALYSDNVVGTPNNIVYQVFGSAVATGGNWVPSDLSLKKAVRPISGALALVDQLNGVSYQYRTEERPELQLSPGKQYGFIADEVKTILPEAVQVGLDELGEPADYDVMNYDMIIPVLTEAIKEQQGLIQQLQTRVDQLETKVQNQGRTQVLPKVQLQQNRPNPFTGTTYIDYQVPKEIQGAQLVVYDSKGVVVRKIAINDQRGSIELEATNFSKGIYFYTVENQGNVLARQKMIVK